jgi:predicted nucleic acid-binding Zn ribbon protein
VTTEPPQDPPADGTPAPDPGTDAPGPEAVDATTPEPAAEHRDDGLDLARAARRAAGAVPGQPTKRPRRRTSPYDSPRRRGGPRTSGAFPSDRDPQLVDTALERLIANHGWELDLRVQSVFGRWAELVGDEVASHCTPESFADTRLVVRTDSTAWATQLKLLAPTVVRRLNEELGHGTVTVIDIQGPHLPSWKKGRFTSRDGRGPRDTYG